MCEARDVLPVVTDELMGAIEALVDDLVSRRYERLEADGRIGRCRADDLQRRLME